MAKTVLLGSNSFSGQDFVDLLLQESDDRVIGISRSAEKPDFLLRYRSNAAVRRYTFRQMDMNRDLDALLALLDSERPERIVNFAAQSEVGPSWEHPEHWFQTNTVALARLINQADVVARVLQSAPHTLLHGDYWPGNISIDEDGRQVVYDWQMVGVGPAVIDLVVFINNSRLWLSPLPVEPAELIELYRSEIAAHTGQTWNEQEWAIQWDFSMMWRFVQEWFSLLALPAQMANTSNDYLLERIWLEPLDKAVYRWLKQLQ